MYTYILFIIPFFNKNLNWFGELFDICSTSACSLQNLPRTGSGAPLFYEHWDNPGLPVISSHIWLPAFSQSGAELCLIREVSSEYNCFPQRGVNTISPSLSLSKLPQIPDINSVSPLSPVRLYYSPLLSARDPLPPSSQPIGAQDADQLTNQSRDVSLPSLLVTRPHTTSISPGLKLILFKTDKDISSTWTQF